LASRELIADSVEIMAMAHPFDALVMVPTATRWFPECSWPFCGSTFPPSWSAAGPCWPGSDREVDLISVFEGVGRVTRGEWTNAQLDELEDCACPGCGSCAGMFTANSMNCLSEAVGLALPGNGTIPAVNAARIRLAKIGGDEGHGALEEKHPAPGHCHPRSLQECHGRGYGPGLFHQHRPAPSGHRP
jgi:dihydroxy-acid dehydratase